VGDEMKNVVIQGDCLEVMKDIPDKSINMVITSPPYADRRKKCYDSISENKYVQWFLPIAQEIKRILCSNGSFFLNIKPHTRKGERSLYVFDLVMSLVKETGFLFIDEFCWIKNPFPGKLTGRFKNAFEPIYHFTISNPKSIKFNPVACGTPIKKESIARAYRKQCGAPKNGSKMTGMNTTNIKNLRLARPSNVIKVNNVSNQFTLKSKHPATFPCEMVEFFIKSFTDKNDIILDPFTGSGTTGVACKNLNRNYILIEKEQKYIDIIKQRLAPKRPAL
jgi:site-specific DNA-methyltransferase (adenine-specific)/site-specific DNA-methyltransferase (cytosine-N4-specific)